MNDKDKRSGLDLARALGLLGGLVTLIDGILSFLSPFESRRTVPSLDVIVNIIAISFLLVVLGLVALMASARLRSLGWSVVLIGVGLLAYHFGADLFYNIGPILLVVAGIIGIFVEIA